MMISRRQRVLTPILASAVALASTAPAFAQRGGQGQVVIPQNTVVRATLEDRLTSREAHVGDRFMARISPEDYSGFPQGTRFEGTVTEVGRPSSSRPGVMDVKIHRAILPDGRMVQATGFLASLDDEDLVRTGRGRVEARRRGSSDKFDWKWVGIGAGGGLVLGSIFGGAPLKGILLGGVGGAIYSYLNKNKNSRNHRDDYRDVELTRGTEFGIRMYDRVVFNDAAGYRYAEARDRRDDRYDDRDREDRDGRYRDDERYSDSRDRDQERYRDRDRDERYEDERDRTDRYQDEERRRRAD